MMYLLFRDKNWKPGDYHKLGPGEKRVIHAFLVKEMDDREEALCREE